MESQIGKEWIAHFPGESLSVKVQCTGQTDDDLYALTVYFGDEKSLNRSNGQPLVASRQIRNVADVELSSDGSTIAILEFDGYVVVWTRQPDGSFSKEGQVTHIGGPIRDLTIDESGSAFTVQSQFGSTKVWVRDDGQGKFVKTS